MQERITLRVNCCQVTATVQEVEQSYRLLPRETVEKIAVGHYGYASKIAQSVLEAR